MRLNEFSTQKLAQYKTAAAADAAKADAAGDFARGHKRFKGINTATKKQFDNDAKKSQLKEFAPSGDDGDGPDSDEVLRRIAAHWWNGTEQQMIRAEQTLAAMGWEIGEDEGYDDGGVFVVRAGDEHGRSYISWPHEELELNEGRKKKKKKSSKSLSRYFFPGFGYYGSGESGEGGGDGGGGESVNPGMEEGEYDSRKPFGVRYKVFAGREGRLTTREYYTSSEEKLQRAVDKIQALDNFYEIDGYSYPKESQGVAEQGYGNHPSQRVDPRTGKKYVPPKSPLGQGVAEGSEMLSLDDKIKIYSKHKSQAQQAENRGDYTTADKHKKQASKIYSNIVNLHFGDDGKDAQNAANEYIRKSQGVAKGLTEMDKSQTPPGRDGNQQSPRDDRQSLGRDTGPRSGPDRYAKPITSKQMQDRALDKLNRAFRDSHKKKDVSEDSISAMRRLAGIVPQVPVIVSNGQRQYRHMPTAVQPR